MCSPAVPAGCGPAKRSTATRSSAGTSIRESAATQTYVVPGQSVATSARPAWKSAMRAAMTRIDIGRMRPRVDGGDEQRMRAGIGGRHLRVRPRAQRRPQAGVEEQRAGADGVERRARRVRPRRLRKGVGGGIHRNDDGFQPASLAAMDGRDGAAGGRQMADARIALVLDERRPPPHAVADRDQHGGFQPRKVRRDPADGRRGRRGVDGILRGRPRQRNVESPGDSMDRHRMGSLSSDRIRAASRGRRRRRCSAAADSQRSLAVRPPNIVDRGQTRRIRRREARVAP